MRRRTKRDLLTFGGIVVILACILGTNIYLRFDAVKEAATKMRLALESKYRTEGYEVLNWDMMRKTRGNMRIGAKFAEELQAQDDHLINICGFMTPIDQFGKVTEFMLLPVPITCYFCEAPPMRDVIRVKLKGSAKMINEPIVVGGRLKLHAEKGKPFFYTIEDGLWNEPVDTKLTDKEISTEHQMHLLTGFEKLMGGTEQGPIDEGYAPPSTANSE